MHDLFRLCCAELLMQAVRERKAWLVVGDGATQSLRLLLEGGRFDRG